MNVLNKQNKQNIDYNEFQKMKDKLINKNITNYYSVNYEDSLYSNGEDRELCYSIEDTYDLHASSDFYMSIEIYDNKIKTEKKDLDI